MSVHYVTDSRRQDKEQLREELERQMAAYKAKGGRVYRAKPTENKLDGMNMHEYNTATYKRAQERHAWDQTGALRSSK